MKSSEIWMELRACIAWRWVAEHQYWMNRMIQKNSKPNNESEKKSKLFLAFFSTRGAGIIIRSVIDGTPIRSALELY